MDNGEDPTARRRQDPEAQRDRDAQAWRLRRAGWSVRAIGRELGMPASSVQRCLQRAQKLADAIATGEPGDVVAVLDDELTAEDVAGDPGQWDRLNPLERYRLRHEPQAMALVGSGRYLPPVHDDDHRLCCIAHGLDPNWQPDDDGTVSWREGVDRARAAGDSETDADDW